MYQLYFYSDYIVKLLKGLFFLILCNFSHFSELGQFFEENVEQDFHLIYSLLWLLYSFAILLSEKIFDKIVFNLSANVSGMLF